MRKPVRKNSMGAFTLHQRVLSEYDAYVRGFLSIAEQRIRAFVAGQPRQGWLWSQPLG